MLSPAETSSSDSDARIAVSTWWNTSKTCGSRSIPASVSRTTTRRPSRPSGCRSIRPRLASSLRTSVPDARLSASDRIISVCAIAPRRRQSRTSAAACA
jgi:hypothetical protein